MSGTAKWLRKQREFPICTLCSANEDPLPTARASAFPQPRTCRRAGSGKRHRAVDSQQIMWEMTVETRVLSRLLQGCVSHKENSVNARAGVNSIPLVNYQQLR